MPVLVDPTQPERGPYMTTAHGKQVFFYDPKCDDLLLEDIAYALAGKYRWGAHTRPRWSVAQHSLLGARFIQQDYALEFLMHDAPEAWLGDILRPIKTMPEVRAHYRAIEDRFEKVLSLKFGLRYPMPPEVKELDNIIGLTESRVLMNHPAAGYHYQNYKPDERMINYFRTEDAIAVERTFLAMAHRLLRERGVEV